MCQMRGDSHVSEQLRYIHIYAIPQSTYTTVATDLMPLSVLLQACVGLSVKQILNKTVIALLLAALHEH